MLLTAVSVEGISRPSDASFPFAFSSLPFSVGTAWSSIRGLKIGEPFRSWRPRLAGFGGRVGGGWYGCSKSLEVKTGDILIFVEEPNGFEVDISGRGVGEKAAAGPASVSSETRRKVLESWIWLIWSLVVKPCLHLFLSL